MCYVYETAKIKCSQLPSSLLAIIREKERKKERKNSVAAVRSELLGMMRH